MNQRKLVVRFWMTTGESNYRSIIKSIKFKYTFVSKQTGFSSTSTMAGKKSLNKFVYNSLDLVYHIICLSGLIWQSVEISKHFFKFATINDINVLMPGMANQSGTAN